MFIRPPYYRPGKPVIPISMEHVAQPSGWRKGLWLFIAGLLTPLLVGRPIAATLAAALIAIYAAVALGEWWQERGEEK